MTHHLFTALEIVVFWVSYLVYKKVWKKRKGKSVRTVERSPPFQMKRGDSSTVCSAGEAML